jgi:hypothetical protein
MFLDRVSSFSSGPSSDWDPPLYASCIAEITCIHHYSLFVETGSANFWPGLFLISASQITGITGIEWIYWRILGGSQNVKDQRNNSGSPTVWNNSQITRQSQGRDHCCWTSHDRVNCWPKAPDVPSTILVVFASTASGSWMSMLLSL